jgi:hypothetical protein
MDERVASEAHMRRGGPRRRAVLRRRGADSLCGALHGRWWLGCRLDDELDGFRADLRSDGRVGPWRIAGRLTRLYEAIKEDPAPLSRDTADDFIKTADNLRSTLESAQNHILTSPPAAEPDSGADPTTDTSA